MDGLKPMDIYSSEMSIPFDVAAYCRGHKLSVEAVNLARAIKTRNQRREEVQQAEEALRMAESAYEQAIAVVKSKMQVKSA